MTTRKFSREFKIEAVTAVSDAAATPDRQSGRDFVIVSRDGLTSPRPLSNLRLVNRE